MSGEIVNRVEKSGLMTIDLDEIKLPSKIFEIDIKKWLFEGLFLKEKDFRNNNYVIQDNLFTYDKNYKNIADLSDIHMKILDNINAKMGKMTIFYGSQGMVKYSRRKKIEKDKWRMRSFYRSPFYTTNWADILKVS